MEAVHFSFRFIINLMFLLLAQADSIIFNQGLINSFYHSSNRYVFSAAELGNPKANFELFQQTANLAYLKKAASLNHQAAVYQWYLIQKQAKSTNQQVWLQQAVNLGHPEATLNRLSQFIDKKDWQQAEHFVQQHRWVLNNLAHPQKQQYLSILSLLDLQFTKTPISSEITLKTPTSFKPIGSKRQNACAIFIQPLVESDVLIAKAQQFKQAFTNSKINQLSICFAPPQVLPELKVICQPDHFQRIDCSVNKLAHTLIKQPALNPQGYSHIVIIVEQGEANTRGGLMYLDKQDDSQVFIHELAHWLGYVDEYQLKPRQQQQLCKVQSAGWISANIFVAPKTMSQVDAQQIAGSSLYSTNTCNQSNYQAYKPLAELSFMEYLDLPLTQTYASHITQHINYAKVIPAAMNFWWHFNEQNQQKAQMNNQEYLAQQQAYWLKIAIQWQHPEAMAIKAQQLIATQDYSQALVLLSEAAELGNANAQLLLGHGYLEGRWLPQSVSKSAFWYKQAAQQNDSYGLYFLAKCHEMGWGCELSLDKAMGYYRQAQKLGNKLAIKRLSVSH